MAMETTHSAPPPSGNGSVGVVIAAFNEAGAIGETVAEVRGRFPWVIVVDDGSRDGTAEAARRAGAQVLRHRINLGQGAALQTGLAWALGRGARYVATFDADGQHDPADLERMVAVAGAGDVDVVLGSRFLGEAPGLPRVRRSLLRLAVHFTNVTTGVKLTDAHNGLRLLTAEAASRIRITQNRMAHASELVEQVGRLKLRYVEVPVRIRYTPYSLRKGQRTTGAARILGDLFTRWMERW